MPDYGGSQLELATLVSDFAGAIHEADVRWPQALSHRSGRKYQPGIGPHAENDAVNLVVAELKRLHPAEYSLLRTGVPYPKSRQKCDLTIGSAPDWAIEIKMARFSGDNGKPDDTSIKDILSPYETDRSAISDCIKLATAGFFGRAAMLIYGFEDQRRPLETIIEVFEVLARTRVSLGPRESASFENLVHPVFRAGRVFAWQVKAS